MKWSVNDYSSADSNRKKLLVEILLYLYSSGGTCFEQVKGKCVLHLKSRSELNPNTLNLGINIM